MKTYLYRASNLKSIITFLAFFQSGSQFWRPTKPLFLAIFFIIMIIIIQHFFIRVFSEDTEMNATSLIPLDINFPEICAFKIGFSCTVMD